MLHLSQSQKMLLNRMSVPLTFSWDTQSHAMPHHTCLREGVCNLCRLSKVGLGCLHLCTALSNPGMALLQLHGFASLWLVGSTKTTSGMFSGKTFKRKNKFPKAQQCCFLQWQKKTYFVCKQINQSPGTCQFKNSRKRGEMPLFCLFF